MKYILTIKLETFDENLKLQEISEINSGGIPTTKERTLHDLNHFIKKLQ